MICELCNKHPATVHVTELTKGPPGSVKASGSGPGSSGKGQPGKSTPGPLVKQKHLCEACAQSLELPHAPVVLNKGVLDIWKLLRQSAEKARAEGSLTCPDCGMSLAEFRSKGRLGCPKDYEVFRAHLEPLLLRVHNAKEHRGRIPGLDDAQRSRRRQLTDLRARLEAAVREEAYEDAARLRDEIQQLEARPERAS
jgi:protein arginine kinase activator